jgi:hypothetical protein
MEQQQPPQQPAPGPWQQVAAQMHAAQQQAGGGMPQLMGANPQYAAAAAMAAVRQQQQLLHQMQASHHPLVLQGTPLPGGAAQQHMPYAITLPGGTLIHPQLSGLGAHQLGAPPAPAPAAGAPASYPQLSGLTFQPGSGIPMIRGHPLTVATSRAPVPAQQQQQQHLSGLAPTLQHRAPAALPPHSAGGVKLEPGLGLGGEDRPSSSHSANTSAGGLGSDGSPHVGGGSAGTPPGSAGMNKSRYRGVSYDRKKAKWRVQIKVAALGKSGVSVGYFDTEEAAARAYDRAAIGLLGRDNPNLQTNFEQGDYAGEPIPRLTGKTREEVKTTLKSERIKVSRGSF